MRHKIVLLLLIFNSLLINAQEYRTSLFFNDTLQKMAKENKIRKNTKFITYTPIFIPFLEDFSNYNNFPDTSLWANNQAFINNGFALNPPTIGVATLDALDNFGKVYSHASASSFYADTLLSRPIRLDSVFTPLKRAMELSDSIWFSFYYQPGGGTGQPWEMTGDAPDTKDSLILDFGYLSGNTSLLYYIYDSLTLADTILIGDTILSPCDPTLYIVANQTYYPGDVVVVPCDSVATMEVIWETVWASPGMSLASFINKYGTYFQQIMIPIDDKKYLNAGFQFRFRNIASLEYGQDEEYWAGNVDMWNIDYIRLNRNRSFADTIIDDVAFVEHPGSILQEYTAMPWSHVKDNTTSFLKPDYKTKLINLDNVVKNTSYEQYILDQQNNVIGNYSGGSYNINPFYNSGFQDYAPHTQPPMANITFPTANNDSVELSVYYIFREAGGGDNNPHNDTSIYKQQFFNYFAYDDGIPEGGYIVKSSVYPYASSLAIGFSLSHSDTLRAIRMYVNRVHNDASNINFTLTVWNDNGGKPGNIIYQQNITQEYSNELYGLQHFQLDEPIAISGNFYIGYQTSNKHYLNIGFDQNNNANNHVFWRTNSNWENSFIFGCPIIRPVVGAYYNYHNIEEIDLQSISIYPNPAQNQLHIIVPNNIIEKDAFIEIYSLKGERIMWQNYDNHLNVSHLSNGFYILTLSSGTKIYHTKFVIAR